MDLSIRFLILVLLGLVLGGSAQASQTDAELLLNQTEANLLELVQRVQENAFNSCDLLSTCNAESTCSRLASPLRSAKTTGYECQAVLRNTNCKDKCPWRNFDFLQSFLRVPGVQAATEDYTTQRQLREIWAHKNLGFLFKKRSNNSNFFRLYFGSVDGTFWIFPGMNEANCSSYDPRTRLWYPKPTTEVNKAVMVLIDNGSSMSDTFGADSVSNLVLMTNTSPYPDFGNFTAMLSSLQGFDFTGNITDAISKVITAPAGLGSEHIPSEFLKVIILIMDSKAVGAISNAALPWNLTKNNNIGVCFYMFPPNIPAINASPLKPIV